MKNNVKIIDRLCKICKHTCKRNWKLGDPSLVAIDCLYRKVVQNAGNHA